MRTLASLLVAVTVVPLMPVQTAHACSCMAQTADQAFEQATMVFRGTPFAEERYASTDEDYVFWAKRYAFHVDTVWKGEPVNGVVIETNLDSAACGVDFPMKEDVTVFAYRSDDGSLHASLCGMAIEDDVDAALAKRTPLTIRTEPDCEPLVCRTGDVHAACDAKGRGLLDVGTVCSTTPVSPFSDVDVDDPAYAAVRYVATEGLFKGYSDGTFRPKNFITRAELVTVLYRNYEQTCSVKDLAYKDIKRDEWYAKPVCYASQDKLVRGYDDNTFRPHQNVTVAEAAKIILRHNGWLGEYDDAEKKARQRGEQWWEPYIDSLNEFIDVSTIDRNPNAPISREDVARILYAIWDAR